MGVFFKRAIHKLLKELESIETKSIQDFQEILELHHLNYFHPTTDKSNKKQESIEELNQYIDYFYAYGKLLYGAELLNRNNIFRTDNQPLLLEEVKSILIPSLPSYNQDILFLEKISDLLTAPLSLDLFENIYSFFQKNLNSITSEIKHIGFFYLINYVSKQQINGTAIFREKIANLYWFGYHQNLITINGKMSMLTYLNFINTTTPFYPKQDLLQFIEKASHLLQKDFKIFTQEFGKATFHFLINDFEEAHNILSTISEIPPFMRFSFRTVALRNALELSFISKSYFPAFFTYCNNFYQYLNREKIHNPSRIKSYHNFLKFIQQFGKLCSTGNFNQKTKIALLEEIKNTEKVYLKFWLLNRIGESY